MKKTILHNLKLMTLLAGAFGILFLSGCNEDEEKPKGTILELISTNDNYSEFAAYYEVNSDILPDLSGETEYTVFVPNNAAFSKLKTTLAVDDLDVVRADVIASVLAFHFVSGTNSKLSAGDTFTTTQKESISINADKTIKEGGSDENVEILDKTLATNGIIYETETILIPPSIFGYIALHLGKVSQTLFLGSDFTILAEIIGRADDHAETSASITSMTAILTDENADVTVFAPSNATFESVADGKFGNMDGTASESEMEAFLNFYSDEAFYGIMANHIVLSAVTESSLVSAASFDTALPGSSVTVFNNTTALPADNGIGIYLDGNADVDFNDLAGTLSNLDAEIVYLPSVSGLVAANGSIYVIAGLLSPPQ